MVPEATTFLGSSCKLHDIFTVCTVGCSSYLGGKMIITLLNVLCILYVIEPFQIASSNNSNCVCPKGAVTLRNFLGNLSVLIPNFSLHNIYKIRHLVMRK